MKYGQFLIYLVFPFHLSAQLFDNVVKSGLMDIRKEILSRTPFVVKDNSNLFLFSDKSVYVPNEMVWFSAFEIDETNKDSSLRPFYVMMVDRFKKKPIWSGRFFEKDHFVAGSFLIPESIGEGNFELIAFGDAYVRGVRNTVFCKDIFVRSKRVAPFTILPFGDYPVVENDTLKMKYLVTSPQPGGAQGSIATLRIYSDSAEIDSNKYIVGIDGDVSTKLKFNKEWRKGNLNLVLNITKDTLTKTEVFAISDYDRNTLPSPKLQLVQRIEADSLLLKFSGLTPDSIYSILVETQHGEELYSSSFYLHNSAGNLRLPLDSLPCGLVYATLSDNKMNVLSSDLVVLQSRMVRVSLTSDSSIYNTRSKVLLKVKCTDLQGHTVRADLSMSCALSKRMKNEITIDRHFYVGKEYENVNLKRYNSGCFWIDVKRKNKEPKMPVSVSLIGKDKFEVFATTPEGRYDIKPDMMISQGQASFIVAVNGESPDGYTLELSDPDGPVRSDLATLYFPSKGVSRASQEDDITQEEHRQWRNTLQTVVVKQEITDDYEFEFSGKDWVCACNHWRCNGCRPLSKPIKGHKYFDKSNNRSVIYAGEEEGDETGRKPYIKTLKALGDTEVFIPVDVSNSTDKEINSTLFWSPNIGLNENGEKTIVFYTNDLKGRFRIVIEGLMGDQPIHAEAEIVVQ